MVHLILPMQVNLIWTDGQWASSRSVLEGEVAKALAIKDTCNPGSNENPLDIPGTSLTKVSGMFPANVLFTNFCELSHLMLREHYEAV